MSLLKSVSLFPKRTRASLAEALNDRPSLGSLWPLSGTGKEGSKQGWGTASTQTGSWATPAQPDILPQALASKVPRVDWNKSLWENDTQVFSLGQVATDRKHAFPALRNFPREGFRERLSYTAHCV